MNRDLRLKILENFDCQADFAQAIGEAEATVSRVIRGRYSLPPERKTKWAEVLKCQVEELFRTESCLQGQQEGAGA